MSLIEQVRSRQHFVALLSFLSVLVATRAFALADPVQVTTEGHSPTVSRDGNWIAFTLGDSIHLAHADGSGVPTTLAEGSDANWNHAGDLILYVDFQNRLLTVNATNAETTHVWTGTGGDRCDHPEWSPVRDEIAVATPALAIVQYPYGPAADVACGCNDVEHLTWSPDGDWIAFGSSDIYKVPRTGGVPQAVVRDSLHAQSFPAWSPDGRFIVFAQEDDSIEPYVHLWVVDARGESFGKAQLTDGPYLDGSPSWSPDGSTIYFDSLNRGGGGIWKIAFDPTTAVHKATWGAVKSRYR